MRLLFVCTGNQCRSPIAERLAVAWAHEALAHSPEHARIRIASAGLEATAGSAMDPHSAAVVRELGGDPTGFRAQVLEAGMAEEADLVLTMTRQHRRLVLESSPRGLRRTYTLLEAADLLDAADLTGLRLLPLGKRAQELGRRLDAARPLRVGAGSDDVSDPIGQGPAVHRAAAATIATALRPLADVLFASVRTQPVVRVADDAPGPGQPVR